MTDFGKGLPNCPAKADLDAMPIAELMDRLRNRQAEMLTLAVTVLHLAREMGMILEVIKKRGGYGNWGAWLQEQFPGSRKTAGNYQRIAKNWHILRKHVDENPRLGIFEALEILREREQKDKKPPSNTRSVDAAKARKLLRNAFKDDVGKLADEQVTFIQHVRAFDGGPIDLGLGHTIAVDYVEAFDDYSSEKHNLFASGPPAPNDPRLASCQWKFRSAIEKILATPGMVEREREFLEAMMPAVPDAESVEAAA